MNKIILSGNLTKDLEIRATEISEVATGTIAVSRTFKNTDGTYDSDFFNFVIWKPNEYVKKLTKGTKVLLEGELRTRTYEDAKKQKKHITEVFVKSIEVLKKKEEEVQENIQVPTNVKTEYDNKNTDITLTEDDYPF